jgi:predicted TIM-barrel fold metal-dependent hydrolase
VIRRHIDSPILAATLTANISNSFPMETTIAVARMLLSSVFDRHHSLTLLLAHSGGTLPFLAGRLESCIAHDAHLKKAGKLEKRRDIWDVLKKNVLLDAVVYSSIGLRAAVGASGEDRLLFGKWLMRKKRRRTSSDICVSARPWFCTSRVAPCGVLV